MTIPFMRQIRSNSAPAHFHTAEYAALAPVIATDSPPGPPGSPWRLSVHDPWADA